MTRLITWFLRVPQHIAIDAVGGSFFARQGDSLRVGQESLSPGRMLENAQMPGHERVHVLACTRELKFAQIGIM